jgi:hypothetical protein
MVVEEVWRKDMKIVEHLQLDSEIFTVVKNVILRISSNSQENFIHCLQFLFIIKTFKCY